MKSKPVCDICECDRTKSELELYEGADGIIRCPFCNTWRYYDVNYWTTHCWTFLLPIVPKRPEIIKEQTNMIYW